MPWETSNRKAELPPDWPQIRRRVLERDGHRCVWKRSSRRLCGSPANQVDHIGNKHDHRDENLQSLCAWHHTQKTQQESAEARRLIQAKALHPVERHPGFRQ